MGGTSTGYFFNSYDQGADLSKTKKKWFLFPPSLYFDTIFSKASRNFQFFIIKDVSRYAGHFTHVVDSVTAGITIQAPQLEINTVAAGGGSRLFFRDGLFVVGPESAGSDPGPICYRKDGHLAVTDANLVLGRILPEYFPHIFGPDERQPLDK